MTPDARITHDLAILGRVHRERPLSLDATLRHVGAVPAVARSTSSTNENVALLPFARIYALRVARIWASAAALTATIGIFVLVVLPRPSDEPPPHGALYEIFYASTVWVFAAAMIPALVAYGIASATAMRRFERALTAEEPAVRARAVVDRVARASIAMPMLGMIIPCLFFGLVRITIGEWNMMSMFEPIDDPVIGEGTHLAFILWAVASGISALGSVALSRRRAASGWWIVLGLLVVFATMTVGMRYDIGPLTRTELSSYHPSYALRAILTATGTLGLILIVGGALVRRRAREEHELSGAE
jgi:hypothetical protein